MSAAQDSDILSGFEFPKFVIIVGLHMADKAHL